MKRAMLGAILSVSLLAGCVSKPKSDSMSMAPSADQVQQIRDAYKTSFPAAKIGAVTAVLDNEPYAMVGDIDTSTLKEGQVMTFLDASQQVIANGSIVKVDASTVAVEFDAGARRPQVGDVAVKF